MKYKPFIIVLSQKSVQNYQNRTVFLKKNPSDDFKFLSVVNIFFTIKLCIINRSHIYKIKNKAHILNNFRQVVRCETAE